MNKDIIIFPHNKRAYEKVCAAFEESNRTCVIHPTGSGKMYISLQLLDAYAEKKFLYLSSYNQILNALREEMLRCGITVADLTEMLYTNLQEGSWSHCYDFIIMDEFHRAGADTWNTKVRKLLEDNPQAKILGLSATPIRYLDHNRDMSDELFDGNIASSMSLAEAVGTGILKMPKYVCAAYTLEEEVEKYKQRIHKMKDGLNKRQALALWEKARRSLDLASGLEDVFANNITNKTGRYIVFCRNYEHLKELQESCGEWFRKVNKKTKIYELRSTLPESINVATLNNFNNDTSNSLKLLLVVDMLNEGVHLSNVDGCIMLRPTESLNIYMQQLGRAISVSKKTNTIVFDIVNNSLQLRAFDAFQEEVHQVIEASGSGIELEGFEIEEALKDFYMLISQIDALVTRRNWNEWYLIAKAHYEKYGTLLHSPRQPLDNGLNNWLVSQRMLYAQNDLFPEKVRMLESIGIAWNVKEAEWDRMYLCAKRFYERHGHLRLAPGYKTPYGRDLTSWVNWQRRKAKDGKLPAKHRELLEEIGMFDAEDEHLWNAAYHCAKTFYYKYGHLRVGKTEKMRFKRKQIKLGLWIEQQRTDYNNGILPARRKELLDKIGMLWKAEDPQWEKRYTQAERHYKENGDLVVPETNDLGKWLSRMRQTYKAGKLSDGQIARLDALGMIWNEEDAEWQEMYKLAQAFYLANRHLKVPPTIKGSRGYSVRLWLNLQRMQNNQGILPLNRKKELKKIGFT